MELRQIRYFLEICEQGSFSRAADRCGVTQPALTMAMKALEGELGGAVFHRRRATAWCCRGLVRWFARTCGGSQMSRTTR